MRVARNRPVIGYWMAAERQNRMAAPRQKSAFPSAGMPPVMQAPLA